MCKYTWGLWDFWFVWLVNSLNIIYYLEREKDKNFQSVLIVIPFSHRYDEVKTEQSVNTHNFRQYLG